MTDFMDSDAAYKSANAATIYLVSAAPGAVATLATAHARLNRLLRDGNDDLEETVQLLGYARFRLAFNLLPADHSALELDLLATELAAHVTTSMPGLRSFRKIRSVGQLKKSIRLEAGRWP